MSKGFDNDVSIWIFMSDFKYRFSAHTFQGFKYSLFMLANELCKMGFVSGHQSRRYAIREGVDEHLLINVTQPPWGH